ncbi:hypothetical protein BIW11_08809 [Tropilaelaps mercedesae]|uniref:C2 domain-containing protein n=1 Tax=Tropilaelaps mercedesae TaxID=418985 RepID=A0A1V9XMY3_9ACAR|nr:hypothetical protein BIW11_08809 [Tropilaelaps mercedesae]
MGNKRPRNLDKFPDISPERCGELALLCLRRCTHYHGSKHREDDLKVSDEELEEYVRTLFKDAWANVNLKKDLSSYDTAHYIKFDFLGAIGLRAADPSELADPYIRIVYNGRVFFTKVKKNTLSPCWNEEIFIGPVKPDDSVWIEVWDWDPKSFLHSVVRLKDVRSFRGCGIYLRELFKCGEGDDLLGGVLFHFREVRALPLLFRKDIVFNMEKSGTLSFYAEFQCSEKDLILLYHSHYYLTLHLLIKSIPNMQQMCFKQIVCPAGRALLRRQAMGLSVSIKTICKLQAIHKAVVKYSLAINAVVMYDLALSLLDADLSDFERLELRNTSTAYKRLMEQRLLTSTVLEPQTPTDHVHLMGTLSLCLTLRNLGHASSLEVAERALNAYIVELGKKKSSDLVNRVKECNRPVTIIFRGLHAAINRLRRLHDLVHMSWSRDLSEVAHDSLEEFAISCRQEIALLKDPEDALKIYQVLKGFCEDFKVSTHVLSRCFSDNIVQVWLEQLEKEAPYWAMYVVKQDLLFARSVTPTSGQLLTKSCEEFLSRLHHNLSGIYGMTSKTLTLSESYAKTLSQCCLHYVRELYSAIEKHRYANRTGFASCFSRSVLIALNNMASTYKLLVTDLEEIVESREESERKQWKHLSNAGEDVFNHWSPRPTLAELRKTFEITAESIASSLADDSSDILAAVCESETYEQVRRKAANLNSLLAAQLDTLKMLTYPSLFKIIIGRTYEITLDHIIEILTNVTVIEPVEKPVFAAAVCECCAVLESFFLDPEYALPYHKVKTPRLAWILHTAAQLGKRSVRERPTVK